MHWPRRRSTRRWMIGASTRIRVSTDIVNNGYALGSVGSFCRNGGGVLIRYLKQKSWMSVDRYGLCRGVCNSPRRRCLEIWVDDSLVDGHGKRSAAAS